MNKIKEQLAELKFKHLPKIETPHKNVDVKFFEAMGITVRVLKFYQVALEYRDLPKGCRFMWYPTTGTLVYEGKPSRRKFYNPNTRYSKQYFDSEEVWNEIMKRCA